MASAIWAIFYDVPEASRDAYLQWFHGVHIPEKLARPGYLWAAHYRVVPPGEAFEQVLARLSHSDDPALGTGAGYIALFGAETTRTFYDPNPSQLRQGQDARTREMVGCRVNASSLILSEEWAIEGPEIGVCEPHTLAPAIQMGRFDAQGHDEDLQSWYAQERMASIAHIDGCVRARKLLAGVGRPHHAILYEFASLAAREAHFVAHEDTQWSRRVHGYLLHAPGSPLVGARIWPPAG